MPEMLRWGDYKRLAEATGFSRSAVTKMIQGYRTIHPLVAEALELLIEARRQKMKQRLSDPSK